tara:strand:- start:775 stop:1416 length:642 start_codon:yes stop_codon:yes gene_type:complete
MNINYNNCLHYWHYDENSRINCLTSLDVMSYEYEYDKDLRLLADVVDVFGVYNKFKAPTNKKVFAKGFKEPTSRNKFKYITKSKRPKQLEYNQDKHKENLTKKCQSELKRLGSKLESSKSLLCIFNDGVKEGLYEVDEVKKIRNSDKLKVIFMDGEVKKINKDEKVFAYIESFKLNQLQQIDPNTGIRDPKRKRDPKMMLSLDDFILEIYNEF